MEAFIQSWKEEGRRKEEVESMEALKLHIVSKTHFDLGSSKKNDNYGSFHYP